MVQNLPDLLTAIGEFCLRISSSWATAHRRLEKHLGKMLIISIMHVAAGIREPSGAENGVTNSPQGENTWQR